MGQAVDGMWRFALSSSSESWHLSDAAATFNARQRPGKVRRVELVVGKHNDKSERHQITALSGSKMFPSSQIKVCSKGHIPEKKGAYA